MAAVTANEDEEDEAPTEVVASARSEAASAVNANPEASVKAAALALNPEPAPNPPDALAEVGPSASAHASLVRNAWRRVVGVGRSRHRCRSRWMSRAGWRVLVMRALAVVGDVAADGMAMIVHGQARRRFLTRRRWPK